MSFTIDTNNKRVIRAKLARRLNLAKIRSTLLLLSILLIIIGGYLVYVQNALGWLMFILPLIFLMINEWWRIDLQNILPNLDSEKPEDIISSDVLAVWDVANPDDKILVNQISRASSYWFVANRIGLMPELLEIAQTDEQQWWPNAIELWKLHKTQSGITASHIAVSMLLTAENKSQLMSTMSIKEDDVLATLSWYSYTTALINSIDAKRASGGIARDWAAGYTPLLDTYARNISQAVQYGSVAHREIFGHQNVIEQLNIIFSSNGRNNCALVGDVGVGKSMCLQAFAESLLQKTAPTKIRYNQIYQIDMASMLTKIPAEQLEYTIQRLCVEAYGAKNIMLYFDNAGAFFGMDGGPDITNIMLPIIEGGKVRMAFSFTQNQWQYVQRSKSALVAALNYQAVQPTGEADTLKILENQALFTEGQYGCLFTYKALKEVYRLADRYGPEIAMPGRAISVLEDTARNNQNSLVTNVNVQQSVEKTTGIKIATADASEKSTLLTLEEELHKRVIGQSAAIREIASALKRSRTGVSNPNKPIGTFLFLGPTGVGKTEVSKTLANVYFGGDAGMVRIDMNEYITQDSVHSFLASGTDSGAAFLDTIRKKPFSVVLFDEIEKAHPDIVNVLLQLLDEGVIRDGDNREVSFKDTIVIATSNAGSEQIRQQISDGKTVEELENHLSDDLIKMGTFKPEFVNRFDAVVVFSPLTQIELRQVVGVMLGDINKQLLNRGISVALTPDAIDWLATQGYDERLGARPLRRMMQKTVETAVSNILLEQELANGTVLTLNAATLGEVYSKG